MSTDNTDIVFACMTDLKEVLQSVATLNDKNLLVYSAEELMNKAKVVPLPAAGVIYEGMHSTADNEPTNRRGESAEATFTILILADKMTLSTAESKSANIHVLGLIRRAMKNRTAPTGHKWRFVLEAPADEIRDTLIWAQRWTAPIPTI